MHKNEESVVERGWTQAMGVGRPKPQPLHSWPSIYHSMAWTNTTGGKQHITGNRNKTKK